MATELRVHDRAILEALDPIAPEPFAGEVWRVTRRGRDPLRSASKDGPWSPHGEVRVLYTSLERDGALAEVHHRLSAQGDRPGAPEHAAHAIRAHARRTLCFAGLADLAPFGIDPGRYGDADHRITQAIAAAAHSRGFDGLIVPSARFDCANLVVFLDRLGEGCRLELRRSEPVDWAAWRARQRR